MSSTTTMIRATLADPLQGAARQADQSPIGARMTNATHMDFVTIDFEASCLPRHGWSFPIEVGISGPMGTRSWLIRPHPAWRDWDWTDEAFGLHGITLDQLHDEGREPRMVVAELLNAIGSARVIADSTIDGDWWNTLRGVTVSGNETPRIRIEHVLTIFDELGATNEQIEIAQRQADLLCPQRHRAGADARWLWTLISSVREQVMANRPRPAWPWPQDKPETAAHTLTSGFAPLQGAEPFFG